MARVLVLCERSGAIRNAFARRGHDVISVDTLPATDADGGGRHVVGDALDWLDCPADLVIARPPCTYLTNSGVRWLYRPDGSTKDPDRWQRLAEAIDFFNAMKTANATFIAIENPIPHKHAAEHIGRPTQYVQPYQFGHMESKRTGWWLVGGPHGGLPTLTPTNDVREQMMLLPVAERNRVHYASPGPDRWMERSRLVEGMADAMADQWGAHVESWSPWSR